MIYSSEFIQFLEEKTGLGYFNGSKTEMICRCPWCESESTKSHGHLYIDCLEPIFYCQRCGETGVTTKIIEKLKGSPKKFITPEILKSSSRGGYVKKFHSFDTVKEYNYRKEATKIEDNYPLKKTYLQGRLGLDFDISSIPNIVFGIKEFVNRNKIELNEQILVHLDKLDEEFIGFVTNRGRQMILRNCDDSSDFRYYKLYLGGFGFFKDFYGIRTETPINNNVNTIVLCEGIFDLLVSVNMEEMNELKENSLFWAACLSKSGYLKGLISVLDYCKLTRANVVVLSDSDTSSRYYNHLVDMPFVNGLKIYWNKCGDDFGKLPIDIVVEILNPRKSWRNKR